MGVHPGGHLLSHDLEFRLDAARRPAIWLKPGVKNSTRSRLGGLPELAPGVAWPRQGCSGTPLHFLA